MVCKGDLAFFPLEFSEGRRLGKFSVLLPKDCLRFLFLLRPGYLLRAGTPRPAHVFWCRNQKVRLVVYLCHLVGNPQLTCLGTFSGLGESIPLRREVLRWAGGRLLGLMVDEPSRFVLAPSGLRLLGRGGRESSHKFCLQRWQMRGRESRSRGLGPNSLRRRRSVTSETGRLLLASSRCVELPEVRGSLWRDRTSGGYVTDRGLTSLVGSVWVWGGPDPLVGSGCRQRRPLLTVA